MPPGCASCVPERVEGIARERRGRHRQAAYRGGGARDPARHRRGSRSGGTAAHAASYRRGVPGALCRSARRPAAPSPGHVRRRAQGDGRVARYPLRLPLLAPPAAVHGDGPRRLYPTRSYRRAEQAGAPGRGLRPATAGAGAANQRSRRRADAGAAARRLRRGDRGGAHLHDHPRHRKAGCHDGHLGDAGRVSRPPGDARGIHGHRARWTAVNDRERLLRARLEETQSSLPPTTWNRHVVRWGAKTHVMAILNLTPDSFSGDGLTGSVDAALMAALRAVDDGADILDLGGESTRPGHVSISTDEELTRLLPALAAIRARTDVLLSVDTSKAAVAAEALAAGANLVNDVRGFMADPEIAAVVARSGVPAVLMHDVPPEPGDDLLTSILRELSRRLDRAVAAGVAWDRLIVDPGFGFGKDWRQNLELLRRLGELKALGRPILAGSSRKSMIGRVLGVAEDDRLEGTAATVSLAIAGGADIVRIHDVRAMARVARMTDAVVRQAPREPLSWPGAPRP